MIGTCNSCNKSNIKIFATFGKWKCIECINKSKTGKKGNSGMIYNPNMLPENFKLDNLNLLLLKVKKIPSFVRKMVYRTLS